MVEIVFNKSVYKDLQSTIAEKVAYNLDFCSESFFDDCFFSNLIQEREEFEYFMWDKTIFIPNEGLYVLEFSILASPFEIDEKDEDAKIPEYEITNISCRKA